MIQAITIENFRCFESIKTDQLKRFNIIVGSNASGKTSFLEACFMVCGGPEIAFRLRSWRGVGDRAPVPMEQESLKYLWRDLFFDLDQDRTVKVSLSGDDDDSRTLIVHCQPQQEILFPKGQESVGAEITSPIIFEWFKGNSSLGIVRPSVSAKGLEIAGAPQALKASFFSSATPLSPTEMATRYSELSKIRQENSIVKAIQRIFPLVEGISIESDFGAPIIYATVSGLTSKIALGFVSSGLNKFAAYLVTIAKQRLIFIDEIENGFYYKMMPNLLSAMNQLSAEYQTQIFASSHSKECLQAVAKAAERNVEDFCLIRVERENGKCRLKQFSGLNFKQAIEQDIEVR